MKHSRVLIVNTMLLTFSAMFMRAVGVSFQVYLSNKIGSAGIGLFELIASVHFLAVTLAVSGIRFAATRLISEELGLGRPGGVRAAVRRCLLYASLFGVLSCALLYIFSEFIGNVWIGDSRTILSLKILSLTLPFISVSSVLGGYFTAVQRVIKPAVVQVAGHFVRIAMVVIILIICPPNNLEYACASISVGGVAAELVSFFLLLLLYQADRRHLPKACRDLHNMTRRMFGIAIPLALSAYARSALSTLQHILVPRGLKKFGADRDTALEQYGVIHGMVFPIILFPSALFYAMSELIIPELTEAQMAGQKHRIRFLVNKIYKLCIIFYTGVTGIFLYFSRELAGVIYQTSDVSAYIRIFALLVPVMYLDAITDGMLKGLGQQIHSMAYNIADSLISVILVYILLPLYAIPAYIAIIFFTECFNFFLSIWRISKVTALDIKLKDFLISAFCITGAMSISQFFLRFIGILLQPSLLSVISHILLSIGIYLILLCLFSAITKNEIRWMKKLI